MWRYIQSNFVLFQPPVTTCLWNRASVWFADVPIYIQLQNIFAQHFSFRDTIFQTISLIGASTKCIHILTNQAVPLRRLKNIPFSYFCHFIPKIVPSLLYPCLKFDVDIFIQMISSRWWINLNIVYPTNITDKFVCFPLTPSYSQHGPVFFPSS